MSALLLNDAKWKIGFRSAARWIYDIPLVPNKAYPQVQTLGDPACWNVWVYSKEAYGPRIALCLSPGQRWKKEIKSLELTAPRGKTWTGRGHLPIRIEEVMET